ncbi:MAG: hypothetical protein ACOYBX_04410 [Mycobacterium sp.]
MTGTDVRRGLTRRGMGSRLALLGMATGTAAAMALGPAAPDAAALDITQDIYTTGPLMGLAAGLGLDTITIPVGDLGPLGESTLILDFNQIANNPVNLYETVNALPFQRYSNLLGATNNYNRYLGASPRQFPATLGAGSGAYSLVEAYRAEIAAVTSGNGAVLPGYTDWLQIGAAEKQTVAAGCTSLNPNNCPTVQPVYATNQELLFLRNPLRPNGGIDSRFGPLLNLFGIDTTMPDAGVYTSAPVPSSAPSGQPANPALQLNSGTLDLTWAYDIWSDFPVTLNPFSLVNSAFTLLPTNLLGGISVEGLDTTAAGLNVAGTLGILSRETAGLYPISDGQSFYGTLAPNDLPLLEPLRLPVRVINALGNAIGLPLNLGTPLADALQPALSILVNTGYTDVQTPAEGGTYNRTYDQSGDYVTFLSQAPLTGAQWLQVPGDVVRALVVGFQDAFPILRFGQTAPVLTVNGNHLAITYPPAAPAPAVAARRAHAPAAAAVTGARGTSRQAAKAAASVKPAKARAAAARH